MSTAPAPAVSTAPAPPERTVHVLVPNDIDDPLYPSGGNRYDREVCDGLRRIGWRVPEYPVHGNWPTPSTGELDALAATLRRLPDEVLVLVDGLIASASVSVLSDQASRLRLVILVHAALDHDDEGKVLHAARATVATSDCTRTHLLQRYALDEASVTVAAPGVRAADAVPGSSDGGRLLSVGVIAPHKGQDVLLNALAGVADLSWYCTLVGSLDRDRPFVARLREQIAEAGLTDRVRLAGARAAGALDAAYAQADLLIHASRAESYGMVATEALARGVPVCALAVGGLAAAVGRAPDGTVPGLLVPPTAVAAAGPDDGSDSHAADGVLLGAALSQWLQEPQLRANLRTAALARRAALSDWSATCAGLAATLLRISA